MRARVLVVLVTAWSLGADQPDDKSKKAVDSLQGEWVVETAELGPMKDTVKEFKGQKGTIKSDRLDGPMGAGKGKSTFKVDPTKSPAEIDLYEDGILTSRGIFALDGGKLTLCIGMTTFHYDSLASGAKPSKVVPEERPTKFDPSQGLLLVLKRAK